MVRLRNLMTKEIVIARRVTTSGMKLAYTTVTSVKADFQPLGSRNSQNFDGSFNKTNPKKCNQKLNILILTCEFSHKPPFMIMLLNQI